MSKNSETNARSTLDVLTGMEVDVHAASELAAALDVMVDTIRDERQPSFKRVALLACDAAEAVRVAWREAVASAVREESDTDKRARLTVIPG
jgi:hypothetical protein